MTADNSMSRRAGFEVACATGLSLALGLVFVFVRSPLPWGWEGFDAYHERALALARDGVFNTTDVPWGYVAFLAGHYRLFGDKPWIPLTTQVLLNATIPFMTYRLARFWLDERTAAVAALLAGVLSLNTVYASTQSSDAVCNVLFLAGVLVFATGWRLSRLSYACAAGALLGLAPQFRPNLLLFPYALAAATLVRSPRDGRVVRYVSAMLAVVIAASLPWTVRNYRVTGRFVPTSTHGPVQLWYGTLEVGEYFNQRTHNPRALFEYPPLPYTSISDEPIVITAESGSCPSDKTPDVEFWTDRDPGPRRIAARATAGHLQYELPGQPADTALYYRFVSARSGAPVTVSISGDEPFVYFISRDHFADLDRHGDLLDVFDVARLVHHVLWADPVPFADRLDADHDGRLTAADLDAAVKALLWDLPATAGEWQPPPDDVVAAVSIEGEAGVLTFRDGSRLVVPRRAGCRCQRGLLPPRSPSDAAVHRAGARQHPPFARRISDRRAPPGGAGLHHSREFRRARGAAVHRERRDLLGGSHAVDRGGRARRGRRGDLLATPPCTVAAAAAAGVRGSHDRAVLHEHAVHDHGAAVHVRGDCGGARRGLGSCEASAGWASGCISATERGWTLTARGESLPEDGRHVQTARVREENSRHS
jgi:hypothetical protein